MDVLDIAILRELSQSNTMLPARVGLEASYWEMARKLGYSRGTVRNRVKKLYASGVLSGSSVYVNPSLLGLSGASFAFDVSPSSQKSDVIEQLKLIESIHTVHNFRGSLIGIHLMYENEADLRKQIDQLLEVSGASEGLLSRVPYPPCTIALDKSEISLIKELLQRGFRSYAGLSRELGVSVRTVKRKLSKLLAMGAILSLPTLDYRAIDSGVPADIIVVFESRESKVEAEKKILLIVREYLVFFGNTEEFVVFNLVLPNFARVNELTSKVRQVEGVKMARSELVDEHLDLTANVRNRLKRLKPSDSTIFDSVSPNV